MTRLQKKCLVASACFHGLTAGVFLATAAFRSEPAITPGRVLTLIPTRIWDRPDAGGGPVPAAAKPQPSQPLTRPAPPATPPQPHPAEPPKTVARTAPKPPARSTTAEKPAPEPAPARRGIKVDLTPVTRSTKPPSKTTETSARAQAAAQEASRKRAQEMSSIFAALDATIHSKEPSDKVVALPGEGGGEAFVNYRTAVFNAYYQAWKTPEETARKLAVADVKIVVARNGAILSSEFVNKSGDAAVDRSVQRALDAVRQLPPFPPNAPDAERSFIIRFNLEAKQDAG